MMSTAPLLADPSILLPGAWSMLATNFPMWLTGETRDVRMTFEVVGEHPLTISEELSYATIDGQEVSVPSLNRLQGGLFIAKGSGMSRLFSSRWSVCGASSDSAIVVVRFEHSRLTPAGINILLRQGIPRPELRAEVAHNAAQFGLSPEDFASLAWLDPRR